ncbi:MAG: SMC family ATPase [Candidatus Babeliales bacterium]|jgi:exonuclease SbcC
MIPQYIELKNFLSYGQTLQRVDFRAHSLICLSGKNGHGKSALLDALTWALWGQARKLLGAVKADDGLLHLGQTHMMVSVEFACSGATYRVRREFARTSGRPYAALDFEIFDAVGNKFISLTEKTIKATQMSIERVVGLDYETFVNSAFIRQGQSNEFSKKSAKERKQILATILGLTHYDQLQQKALEKVKFFTDEKRGLLVLQGQYTQELATEGGLITRLGEQQGMLETCRLHLDASDALLHSLQQEMASCHAGQQAARTLQQEIIVHHQKTHAQREQLREVVNTWRQTHASLIHLPDYNVVHETKRVLMEREVLLMEQRHKALLLHERMMELRDRMQQRSNVLNEEHLRTSESLSRLVHEFELVYQACRTQRDNIEQQYQTLRKKTETLRSERAGCERACAIHDKDEQSFDRLNQQFDKRRAFYQVLVQRGNWTKNELAELEHKCATLSATHNPSCPLCEQLLTVKRKQFLGDRLHVQQKFLTHRLERLTLLMKKLKELLVAQHEERTTFAIRIEQQQHEKRRLEEVSRLLVEHEQEVRAYEEQLTSLREKEEAEAAKLLQAQQQQAAAYAVHQTAQTADAELAELARMMSQLEQEKQSLINDEIVYRELQLERARVDQQIAQLASLNQVYKTQHDRRDQCSLMIKELKHMKHVAEQMTQRLQTYALLDERERALQQQLEDQMRQRELQMRDKERMLHEIGSVMSELQRIAKVKEAAERIKDQIKQLDVEIDDYQAIATAASKNGIQALLIEEAIPELEQEANAILGRLTDNRAHIFIESLRDLKSGGVKESLDIHISDSAGIRPYEMYSGGEAFRIDFALRIAIAKLLARRAGTSLQTLIIDEGFGSQDEDGLSHIMEVLHTIRDDFAKILVVSHLAEFKHNFPVHFIVEKGPVGSIITVEERG